MTNTHDEYNINHPTVEETSFNVNATPSANDQAKGKLDVDAFANKLANSTGKLARKGVDFVAGLMNPDNIRTIKDKASAVAQSVNRGWNEAAQEDGTVDFDDIKDKMKDAVNTVKDKAIEVKDKVAGKTENAVDALRDKTDGPEHNDTPEPTGNTSNGDKTDAQDANDDTKH